MGLSDYIDKFGDRRIVVIGDVMLDKYIFGRVQRISPEAPVPIVVVEKETYVPGGAANAANNIASLGAKAFLLGTVGNDDARHRLIRECRERSINTDYMVVNDQKPTTQKIRAVGNKHQLLRIDYEDRADNTHQAPELMRSLEAIDGIDAIIVSDYAKGTVTPDLMAGVKAHARKNGALLLVDPKPGHQSMYREISMVTPNRKEAQEISGIRIETEADIEAAGHKILTALQCSVLITRGSQGMSLFVPGAPPVHIPTVAKEVYDVSGAGDTVIAVMALALTSGAPPQAAARLANHAAGIKVAKLGTSPVYVTELNTQLRSRP